jgi:hypothetical protein
LVREVGPEVIDVSGGTVSRKVAVTVLGESIDTWQVVEVPEQAPLQPPNRESAPGVAVRITEVPSR